MLRYNKSHKTIKDNECKTPTLEKFQTRDVFPCQGYRQTWPLVLHKEDPLKTITLLSCTNNIFSLKHTRLLMQREKEDGEIPESKVNQRFKSETSLPSLNSPTVRNCDLGVVVEGDTGLLFEDFLLTTTFSTYGCIGKRSITVWLWVFPSRQIRRVHLSTPTSPYFFDHYNCRSVCSVRDLKQYLVESSVMVLTSYTFTSLQWLKRVFVLGSIVLPFPVSVTNLLVSFLNRLTLYRCQHM